MTPSRGKRANRPEMLQLFGRGKTTKITCDVHRRRHFALPDGPHQTNDASTRTRDGPRRPRRGSFTAAAAERRYNTGAALEAKVACPTAVPGESATDHRGGEAHGRGGVSGVFFFSCCGARTSGRETMDDCSGSG